MKELSGMFCALVVVLLLLCGSVCADPGVLADMQTATAYRYALASYAGEASQATQEERDELSGLFQAYRAIGVVDPLIEAELNASINALLNGNCALLQESSADGKLALADLALGLAQAAIYSEDWEVAAQELATASGHLTGANGNLDSQATFNGTAEFHNQNASELLGFPGFP